MSSIKHFFQDLKNFKELQSRQKMRGLNNYNLLSSVLKIHDEVRLHTRMIYSLLNRDGDHFQKELFLDIFLKNLKLDNFDLNSANSKVYKEYKGIDLYITDESKHIIIENKVNANDGKNQIKKYIEAIKKDNNDALSNDILVVYLSLNREKPSPYSLEDLAVEKNYIMNSDGEKVTLFKSIHYKNEILNWLKESQYEVQNITNLNESIGQYIEVVEKLTSQHKEKIMSVSDFITEDLEKYKLAMEIQNSMPKVRKEVVDKFFTDVQNELGSKLGGDWILEIKGNLAKRYHFPFRIYKKNWNNLIFGFEFNVNNYYSPLFGIVKKEGHINIDEIYSDFQEEIEKINFDLKKTKWWLHWEWVTLHHHDFVEYILSDKSKEKFINRVLELLDIFENNSGLLTKINQGKS
jgi:hypothetical protein